MGDSKEEKRVKSFNLKEKNASKIENIAFKKKIKQSSLVDEMVEEYEDGSR